MVTQKTKGRKNEVSRLFCSIGCWYRCQFFISNVKIIICVQAYTCVAKIKVIFILLKVWSRQKAKILYKLDRGPLLNETWPHFYQTRSAWSVDQGSNKNHSPAYNFAPTVTKFCVMWEGLSLPHDTKFGNCRCKIVDSRSFPSWSLIHGLRWSGLIKVGPGSVGLHSRITPKGLK